MVPHSLTYMKATSIKSQVIPDFIAEWTEVQTLGPLDLSGAWIMYFDGSKRVEGAGAGIVLISPRGDKLRYVLRMNFRKASNNEADRKSVV